MSSLKDRGRYESAYEVSVHSEPAAMSHPYLAPGVWGVLPTPFAVGSGAVDESSVRALVRHYASVSVDSDRNLVRGVVALGVFGEAARLNRQERLRVIELVLEEAGSLEVVAGIAFSEAPAVIEEIQILAKAFSSQLRALMLQINTANGHELVEFLHRVQSTSDLPLVLQDYPAITGVRIEPSVLAEAASRLDFVAAIKCESPPTSLSIAQMATIVPNIPLFGGLGGIGLLDELFAGAAGVMTGFSHPQGLAKVIDAWWSGGFETARESLLPWLPLINFEGQPSIGLAIRKEHFRLQGIIETNVVRPPGASFPPELESFSREHLQALGSTVK